METEKQKLTWINVAFYLFYIVIDFGRLSEINNYPQCFGLPINTNGKIERN